MGKHAFPGHVIPQAIDEPNGAGEPALWLVLTERDAKSIIAATENGSAYQVIEILKRQPWWTEICAAVRELRYLRAERIVDDAFSGN